MKKIFLSFLLVMAGISHTLAQGLDGNVEQRLKDFFTRYETSYANIGKCTMGKKYFPPLYCRQRTGRQTHRPLAKPRKIL